MSNCHWTKFLWNSVEINTDSINFHSILHSLLTSNILFSFFVRNNTSDPPEVKLLEHVIEELSHMFHSNHYLVMQVSKFITNYFNAKIGACIWRHWKPSFMGIDHLQWITKKHIPPVFQHFVFLVYLRNRLSYKKIYLHLFASISEALSAGTRIFHIRS